MQKTALVVLFLLTCMISQLSAQFKDPFRFPDEPQIMGGVGVTWIDTTSYTTITLAPDLSFGKFGVGVYLQLLFNNSDGFKFRDDEYKDGAGILRAIRYLRYGQKYDPYYFRVGSLDRATLGNGFLVWNYNNGSNYDKRKVGLEADIDFDKAGFETVWSSVGTSNMRAANLFVRPLRAAGAQVPVFDKFRIYSTYVRDSQVAETDPATEDTTAALTAYGFGADLQWLDLPILKSAVYFDYSKFKDFGSGQTAGINFIFPEFIGLFGLSARFEKRFLGEQFIPNLFGPLYELRRELNLIEKLSGRGKAEGYYGELAGHIIQKVRLIGSFQKLNGIAESGVLHLEASAPNLVPKIQLRGYYDKLNINDFKDARTLDIDSHLAAEVGYELNQYMVVGVVYRWHWVEEEDDNGVGTGVFKPIERVEPRISFRYNF